MSKRNKIQAFVRGGDNSHSPLERNFDALCAAVAARQPLVFVDTYDYETFDRMLLALKNAGEGKLGGRKDLANRVVAEFMAGHGVIQFETKNCEAWKTEDAAPLSFARPSHAHLALFLKDYLDVDKNDWYDKRILVLRGISAELEEEPMFTAWLRAIVGNNLALSTPPMPVFVVGPGVAIPEALQPFSALIRLDKPSPDEIRSIVLAWADANMKMEAGTRRRRRFDNEVGTVVPYLSGRCESEIVQVLNYIKDEGLSDGLQMIRESKRDMVRKSGFLELKEPQKTDFAGLDVLRAYLTNVRRTIELIRDGVGQGTGGKARLQMPKGLLMVGMPGCGKSLIAKVAAHPNYLNRPLIQLDVGRLLGKYVGQSEERMNRALEIADAAAPCILWIDELEKAFSGLDSSDGTSKRLLGRFLTWMQDKTSDVYVIATANSLEKIPPEMKRRGRFDEIFRLMLPNWEERKRLFEFYCKKTYSISTLTEGDYAALARESDWKGEEKGDECFSASDIESIVVRAIQRAVLAAEANYPAQPEGLDEEATETWRKKRRDDLDKVMPTLADFRAEIAEMRGKSQRDRIENYAAVKEMLEKSGYVLASK